MSRMLSHAIESEIEYRFKDNLIPVEVKYSSGSPNLLTLSNGNVISSPCLNCNTKPCLYFDESNRSDKVDVAYSENVCPTNALYLDELEQVVVDKESCIGCGLCVFRCNTGAIYLDNGSAIVHRDLTNIERGELEYCEIKYTDSITNNIEHKTMELLSIIRENKKSSHLATNLFKSIFMSLGFKVIKPRVGDVNLRMDLILDCDDKLYLVEVDNIGSPDTIRDIIDDIAIFSDKYKYTVDVLDGVSCLLEFPNKRSEFYELISDTQKVLKFNIFSLSLGVLLAVLYSRKQLVLELFSINENNTSCRSALEKILDHQCGFDGKSSPIEAAK